MNRILRKLGDDSVERDLDELALARGQLGRVDLRLGETVNRAETKARRARAENSARGQDRRCLHVGCNQAEASHLVSCRLDHPLVARGEREHFCVEAVVGSE